MPADKLISIFPDIGFDRYTKEEQVAFLRGYRDAVVDSRVNRLSLIRPETGPPEGLEEPYRNGWAQAELDIGHEEEKDAEKLTLLIASMQQSW